MYLVVYRGGGAGLVVAVLGIRCWLLLGNIKCPESRNTCPVQGRNVGWMWDNHNSEW